LIMLALASLFALSSLAAPAEAAITLPVDPRHLPPRLTAEWLAGSWVIDQGHCYGSDFGVTYMADGRFSDYWFAGRYRIKGRRIWHRIDELTASAEPEDRVGQRFTRRVRLIGPNEIEMDPGPNSERFYRCPAGGMRP
jgi:hypothetical protein